MSRFASTSSAIPSAKYSWSLFSLRSVNGSTAMDFSLTTFVAACVGCFVAARLASQNLSANSAASAATTPSPAASRIRFGRDLGCAAEARPAGVAGATATMVSGAARTGSRIASITLTCAASMFPA